jgi:pyruvate-ferredoxin/flavodoxin oxidoreductase
MIAMTSGWVYVARVAFGAKMAQTTRAFLEAEAYPGPSIIIAYSPCIAHGYDLCHNVDQQKRLVDSGLWPLYRFDPRRIEAGEPPLVLDSREPKIPVEEFMRNEARFLMAERLDPDRFKRLMKSAQASERQRFSIYQQLAGLRVPSAAIDESAAEDGAPPNGAGE